MHKKRILILGTGNAQVDFIEFCKKSGFEVYACSYKPEGRGMELSDHFEVININDIAQIRTFVINKQIDIVYSTGSDIAMPTIAAISEDLYLPTFISSETATICNNKAGLRKVLHGIPQYNVASMELQNEGDYKKWDILPAIIKPLDSQGQRGITEILSTNQLNTAFKKAIQYSLRQTAIVEEYIEGFEISVNIYVVNGDIKLLFVTERISFNDYPGGIIKSHQYPVTKDLNYDKVEDMSKKAIEILNIKNGPAYFQVKINSEGNPKIIEVTPRLDGCHIWRMIKELKGINLFEIVLNHLCGKKVDDDHFLKTVSHEKRNAKLSFFTSPPNTVFQKSNYNPIDEAIYTEWYYNEGEIIRPINQYAEKTGYQIILY